VHSSLFLTLPAIVGSSDAGRKTSCTHLPIANSFLELIACSRTTLHERWSDCFLMGPIHIVYFCLFKCSTCMHPALLGTAAWGKSVFLVIKGCLHWLALPCLHDWFSMCINLVNLANNPPFYKLSSLGDKLLAKQFSVIWGEPNLVVFWAVLYKVHVLLLAH